MMRRLSSMIRPAVAGMTLCLAATAAAEQRWAITDGETMLTLTPQAVTVHDIWVEPMGRAARGVYRTPVDLNHVSILIDADSDFVIIRDDDGGIRFEGAIWHEGGLAIGGRHEQRWLDTLAIVPSAGETSGQLTAVDVTGNGPPALTIQSSDIQFDPIGGVLFIRSHDVALSPAWLAALDQHEVAGESIGTLVLRARLTPLDRENKLDVPTESQQTDSSVIAGTIGPDVIVGDLHNTASYGSEGDIAAFAIGTISCNQGDELALWISNTNQHPVIAQNMYRLKNDRFEQIGQSWLKHGFAVAAGNTCGFGCDNTGSTTLGVGCSDPYGASLNGQQGLLGPRSIVDPYTGFYVYERPTCTGCTTIDRRLQVHHADLDPALNPDAMYFGEGHYVTADDALAGNGENNVGYRRLVIGQGTGTNDIEDPCRGTGVGAGEYCAKLTFLYTTQRRQPAIRAWQDHDVQVQETDVHVPGEGLFILAAKAIDRGNGNWEYSYALQNINSDRAAGSLSLPLPEGTIIGEIGFNDVDYHSGEPYDGTDWAETVTDSFILWSTETHGANPNGNALRWGTLYSFWFVTNAPPGETTATIGLFKPGDPNTLQATTLGPGGIGDCQPNEIPDACDISCDALGCEPPCGGSEDCNRNGIPDECEPDCNENGIVDACDISGATSTDCQPNGIPDECEEDCDGDTIPDDCDPPEDCDNDGIEDCSDYCECTSPIDSCICPPIDLCCFDTGFCFANWPRDDCLASGGTPSCGDSPCVGGCTVEEIDGDVDRDGDRDIVDGGTFFACFSGPSDAPGFVEPTVECRARFDFDDNGAIEHADFKTLFDNYSGPMPPPAP